jgi:hypothetical protein
MKELVPQKAQTTSQTIIDNVYNSMSRELKDKCNEINNILRSINQHSLLKFWEIGKIIYEIESDKDKFDSKAVKKISVVTGIKSVLLYKFRHFYTFWPSKEQVQALIDKYSNWLNWKHVNYALQILDKKKSEEFLEESFSNKLTTDEMWSLLKNKYTSQTTPRGPRKAKKFDSFLKFIINVHNKLKQLYNTVQRNWLSEQGFESFIENLPKDEITENVLDKINETMTVASQLRSVLDLVYNNLEFLYEQCKNANTETDTTSNPNIVAKEELKEQLSNKSKSGEQGEEEEETKESAPKPKKIKRKLLY